MKEYLALTILVALLPLATFAQTTAPSAPQPAQQAIPAAPAPPAPPMPPRHGHMHEQESKEPMTYLGVETSDVPRVLSAQMGLPRGFGVVVDYVAANSPASAAGLQPNDIIKMLNDQIIVDPGQLGKLVRSFADGTSVNMTVLRKGQELKLTVKLAKRDVSSNHNPFGSDKEWRFDDFGDMDFNFQMPDMTVVRDAVQRAKAEAMRASDEARKAASRFRIVTTDDDGAKVTKVDLGKATISFSDEHGELTLERVDGKKMLTATDADGKVTFQGPIDTDEQRAKIPANVRERVEKLEKQNLPEIPAAPEAPEPAEDNDNDNDDNESAQLQVSHVKPAGCLSRADHSGWRRSTILL
jgi:membrane-associated protease RseP (regulator of RpoE activity)